MNNDDLTARTTPVRQGKASEIRAGHVDGGEVSALARHGDPSQPKRRTAAQQAARMPQRRAVWVRPSELLTQAGGRAAGRGIDLQTELARRARRLPAQAVAAGRRTSSRRARRLPPVTAFGRRSASQPATARAGIGLR